MSFFTILGISAISLNLLAAATDMNAQYNKPMFPTIEAETLSRKKVVFPEVARGQHAFILIAFRRQTQGEVDSWLDPFVEDFAGREGITFYEIPMISGGWKWMSSWIDSGMRQGVPQYKHDHVATYYGPLKEYHKHLEIRDTGTVHAFLLDQQGRIIWRDIGPANDRKYSHLKELVKKVLQ
jgi:hypothetical protein